MPQKTEALEFMHTNIIDAMSDVAEVFKNEGLETCVDVDQTHCALVVGHGSETDFIYGTWARETSIPTFMGERSNIKHTSQYYIEVYLQEGSQQYNICGYSKNQLIADIIDQYEKHLYFLHQVR